MIARPSGSSIGGKQIVRAPWLLDPANRCVAVHAMPFAHRVKDVAGPRDSPNIANRFRGRDIHRPPSEEKLHTWSDRHWSTNARDGVLRKRKRAAEDQKPSICDRTRGRRLPRTIPWRHHRNDDSVRR